ncbi:MAG: LytTR family DNA-binding domain-containing protein [Ruminococcus sp.]|nr:LytTR family DNA-binding domain-containing protein [Ruminococcus sp.]MCM1480524.1 LytTR family DNA-binding domain-containing protein [Muribaculaceae bacterium]
MQLTIALCDDDGGQVKNLRRLIGEWAADKPFAVNIAGYESGEQFLFEYRADRCGLLLLDIEMGGINGMELARKLRAGGDLLPIIFITGYADYMSDGYEVEALHYLLKPVERDRLFAALDRYAAKREVCEEIILAAEEGARRVSAGNIVYAEAFGRKTEAHLRDGSVLRCNMSIGEFEKFDGFIHCHRSYIVNLKRVGSITKSCVTVETGEEIPLSRRLYRAVNESFIEFYTRGD